MHLQCLTFFLQSLKLKKNQNKVQVYHLQKELFISPLCLHNFLYIASNSQDIYILISPYPSLGFPGGTSGKEPVC